MSISNLEKKIGQLMIFGFNGKTVTTEMKDLIENHHVGGIILFTRNIGTVEEVHKLTNDLQRIAKNAGHERPLFICIDQENGVVRRLGEGTTIFPGSMLLGATGKEENAYLTGKATGEQLKALGINWNLAPVLDINNNPQNPVIGVRSFGETADSVSKFGVQSMKGMQEAGVITALKHFPGHGDTHVDSHLAMPTIDHPMERLEEVELKPFVKAIEEGADTVMCAHVYFPAIESKENVPATLSRKVVTNLLREKLGFNGVVTTDCMEMDAISKSIGTPIGGVEAIKAGIDLIMVSHLHARQYDTLSKIKSAVSSGEISTEMIDLAYERVTTLKERYLTWDNISFDEEVDVAMLIPKKQHDQLALDMYKQGITIVKNEGALLPLTSNEQNKVLVVYVENRSITLAEDKHAATFSLGTVIREHHKQTEVKSLSTDPTDEEIKEIGQQTIEYDQVIIGTSMVSPGDIQTKLVEEILKNNEQIVVVSTRSPYDMGYLPETVPAYINTYEFTPPALQTVAQAIFGKINVKGKLPVTLP